MEAQKAVLATLAYADVFHYPLSFSEIYKYLIAKKDIPEDVLKKTLRYMPQVLKKNELYCFSDRKMLIKIRQVREHISKKKLKKAKKIAHILSLIPTISLIGVSGAVAMENATLDDDIDFFIITKTNTVWLSRFLILVLLILARNARTRNNASVQDKICLNMLIDESSIAFPKTRQSLYVAHEIVQMKPLFARNNIYQLFLRSNTWVLDYLPHAFVRRKARYMGSIKKEQKRSSILELLMQKLQLWYMKARTRETVTKHVLAFHPRNYEYEIMQAYAERMKKYGTL